MSLIGRRMSFLPFPPDYPTYIVFRCLLFAMIIWTYALAVGFLIKRQKWTHHSTILWLGNLIVGLFFIGGSSCRFEEFDDNSTVALLGLLFLSGSAFGAVVGLIRYYRSGHRRRTITGLVILVIFFPGCWLSRSVYAQIAIFGPKARLR
jgi:uncharacterized membrane protein